MQPARIDAVCRAFTLGRPTGQPIRIAGAMSNPIWRVRTERGSFFIKLLNWGEAGPAGDWYAALPTATASTASLRMHEWP
jgi:hypothetical protein